LLNVAVSIFGAGSGIDLFFFVLYTGMFAWWVYEIFKFMLYLSLSLRIEKQQSVRRELFNLILNILKIVIAFVVVLIILSKIGVNITGLITSLGIGGIVIGLSAKDTLTNFFDSIRLVGENAFNLGDWIQTEDVQGFVTEIGLAATRIRTFDNALVTIPNSKLASGYIKNWSKRIIGRRIKFQLKLKYTYDTAEIDRVLFEIREMVEQHPDIVNDNKLKYLIKMKQTYDNGLFNTKDTLGVRSTLMVYLDHIDSYSMNILIYAFSISVNWEEWLGVKQDVIKKIIAIIDESELELALPAQDILVESSIDESPIAYQNVDSL
jgi:MscS family membrane protein